MNRQDTTAAPAATQPERAAFEAWFGEYDTPEMAKRALARSSDGKYLLSVASQAWTVWQARAALAAPTAQEAEPAKVESLADFPEGCTPTDAQILRKANHDLAAESFELQAALRDIVAQADKVLARFDIAAAQPDAGAAPEGWHELAARVMDALAEAQERTNRECPRHVECYPGWVTHARWLRWHAEMFRTGRPIGNGAGQPEVLAALAAAPQAPPAAPNCQRCSGSGEDPESYYDNGERS